MSGFVSDESALPSLVSGMSTCNAAKRFPIARAAATMGVTRSASGKAISSPARTSWRAKMSRPKSRCLAKSSPMSSWCAWKSAKPLSGRARTNPSTPMSAAAAVTSWAHSFSKPARQ